MSLLLFFFTLFLYNGIFSSVFIFHVGLFSFQSQYFFKLICIISLHFPSFTSICTTILIWIILIGLGASENFGIRSLRHQIFFLFLISTNPSNIFNIIIIFDELCFGLWIETYGLIILLLLFNFSFSLLDIG